MLEYLTSPSEWRHLISLYPDYEPISRWELSRNNGQLGCWVCNETGFWRCNSYFVKCVAVRVCTEYNLCEDDDYDCDYTPYFLFKDGQEYAFTGVIFTPVAKRRSLTALRSLYQAD